MTGHNPGQIVVLPDAWNTHLGRLEFGNKVYRCAVGKGGVTATKREGDHKTPIGCFPLRFLMYRPDRFDVAPATGLDARPLSPEDGWCDDPADPMYNRHVRHPYPASAERLWRSDHVYDLIVPLGYNDVPPVAGLGSAVFMHVARAGHTGTEGCIALMEADLIAVLGGVTPETDLVVRPPSRSSLKER